MAGEIVITYPFTNPDNPGVFTVDGNELSVMGNSYLPVANYPTITVRVRRPEYDYHYQATCDETGFWRALHMPLIQGYFEVPLQVDAFEASTYETSQYHAVPYHGTLAAIKVPMGANRIVVPVINNAWKLLAPSLLNGPLTIKAYNGTTPTNSTVFAAPVHITMAVPTTIKITEPLPGFVDEDTTIAVAGTTTGNPAKVKVKLEY